MEANFDKIYYRATKYCSYAERCTFDVKKKLIEWKVEDKLHKKILDRLTDEGYINNSRYISSYVNGKFANNKWGKTKIKYSLITKGFDSKAVDAELEKIDEAEYNECILRLAKVKIKSVECKKLDSADVRNKTISYLLSKGFELNAIMQNIENMF